MSKIRSSLVRISLGVIFCAFTFLVIFSPLTSHGQMLAGSSNPATIPEDRLAEGWWGDRHKQIVEQAKADPGAQPLLIGDSITNNYDKSKLPDENFQPTWKIFYQPRRAVNLGFSGDTTANVLWRLDHGEVDGLHPKVAVLLIGTNNTGWKDQTAEQTEVGIDAVVADMERRLPETHILLLGILPSEVSPKKSAQDSAVNHYLSTCYGENPRVTYLDIHSIFYKGAQLNTAIYYDPRLPQHGKALHPDTDGQRMMDEAIEPTLARLMGEPPRVPLSSMTDINPALIPVPWLEQDSYDWYGRHHAELTLQKQINPRVVLIGDSITHFWDGLPNAQHVSGPTAWRSAFGDYPTATLSMGFGWDRIQNVLWRLQQGEFEGLNPQWVVLMIGTNNLTGTLSARPNTPEEILQGIEAIRDQVHQLSPRSRIVLMAILPRGFAPGDVLRAPILRTNQLLKEQFGQDPSITYLDVGQKLLASDGSLAAALMPDGTHPSDEGYQVRADALKETFAK